MRQRLNGGRQREPVGSREVHRQATAQELHRDLTPGGRENPALDARKGTRRYASPVGVGLNKQDGHRAAS